MTLHDADKLLTEYETSTIYPLQYKFKSDSQLAIIYVERPGGGGNVEVHVHYARLGNGILTGANIRWPGESSNASVTVDTGHRLIRRCDELVYDATQGYFDEDVWTRWNL